ncbi:hypothetical protein LFX25_00770 [Leptospira sp. FAT2]|uniref:hypothetical protein n=1 Tax=Leptospira sanjuanensis TaxID=2879643 RepID=UPI001EE957AD|nr:hypothetical protein [Leptospira sanjuanensis]MCG6166381.1 hypothetical protein [Leptospira sanjuanensis]MCG6191773.1 hypothetical protein [Leptospira sanjuanensis]
MLFPYRSFLKKVQVNLFHTIGVSLSESGFLFFEIQGKEIALREGPNDRRRIVRINSLS